MVRTGLLVVSVIAAAALWARAADADIRIAVAGDMTGANAWFGEQYQRGTELAVADLNAKGGVLGQRVELIVGDDACDPEQAVALARKLASDDVVFVAGHFCSHASIAAAKVYEEAGILHDRAELGERQADRRRGPNVFRVCGRDDRQGTKVADHLAEHWADKEIAILDDGTVVGRRRRQRASGAGCTSAVCAVASGRDLRRREQLGVLRAGREDASRRHRCLLCRRSTTAKRA